MASIVLSAKQVLLLTVADVTLNYETHIVVSEDFIARYIKSLNATLQGYSSNGKSKTKMVEAEFPSLENSYKWNSLFNYDIKSRTFSCREESRYEIIVEMDWVFYVIAESVQRLIMSRILRKKSKAEKERARYLTMS